MQSEPWTQEDVAAFLKVHVKTVRKLGVPSIPVVVEPGHRPLVRYDRDEVMAWWAERVRAARDARTHTLRALPAHATRPVTGQRAVNRAVRLECVDPRAARREVSVGTV